ncbi:MAG: hypothetical protein PHU06_04615, partial [Gallionella sp.]|nr:hypothetical protein [Gallionella sp.]MDD4960260.1 hypothetical protein [Gallionella sp.]
SVRRSLLSHGLDVPEGYRTAVPNQIRLTNKKLTLSSKLSIQGDKTVMRDVSHFTFHFSPLLRVKG